MQEKNIMIPKMIHYCWFGGNPLPESTKKYIRTWKQFLPDYKITEWNETNFDIQSAPAYVREAYEAKKYAFVSDYVRVQKLLQYGGIYFDTDVEVVRPFEQYLQGHSMVAGFEGEQTLSTAFIACSKGHPFMEEFEKTYHGRHFIREDGSMDLTVINTGFSRQAGEWGIDLSRNEYQETKDHIAVYPIAYFSAFDIRNWHENPAADTCTIHHMDASWMDKKGTFHIAVIKSLQKILGYERYDRLKGILKKAKRKTQE